MFQEKSPSAPARSAPAPRSWAQLGAASGIGIAVAPNSAAASSAARARARAAGGAKIDGPHSSGRSAHPAGVCGAAAGAPIATARARVVAGGSASCSLLMVQSLVDRVPGSDGALNGVLATGVISVCSVSKTLTAPTTPGRQAFQGVQE